ncbi:alpha/beta fold hydrolase [Neisseria wadsworthii]|uniref:AB hydrolase-1 domain-containing protein n=1 Tax=Neisseria wadsworthii 9715 TaxID=1030841 RepID=G4CMS9_9NEIS|nr:alpha/beta hydrolase [Neisseria wadsworthii]EGZ50979.1 hypothetical protein HMPREF9370_0388 [Neisseria wadsworthii 9715]QMT36397.1 alpha/beta hydrolase [Neisseria wadsworthii]
MNTIETHTFTLSDDLSVACHTAGRPQEEAWLFLHGGGLDSAMLSWREIITQWPGNEYLVAPDLPGYGQSSKPDIDYTLDFYTELLYTLWKTLGLQRINLCGLSLGGSVALQFALRYPHLLKRLVLVAPWGISTELPWPRLGGWYARSRWNLPAYRLCASRLLTRRLIAATLFGDAGKISTELVDEVRTAALAEDAGKAFQSFQLSETYGGKPTGRLLPELPKIDCPVLLVHGSKDPAVPLADAEAAATIMPQARLEVFEEHKHWPQKESPERFLQTLAEFTDATAESV